MVFITSLDIEEVIQENLGYPNYSLQEIIEAVQLHFEGDIVSERLIKSVCNKLAKRYNGLDLR